MEREHMQITRELQVQLDEQSGELETISEKYEEQLSVSS